jgi:pimeloyl-ACP methyl ester carboxylesterase
LEKPVVGHSMGGIVAFDLAARYPGLPSAIVMLDAAVVLP